MSEDIPTIIVAPQSVVAVYSRGSLQPSAQNELIAVVDAKFLQKSPKPKQVVTLYRDIKITQCEVGYAKGYNGQALPPELRETLFSDIEDIGYTMRGLSNGWDLGLKAANSNGS